MIQKMLATHEIPEQIWNNTSKKLLYTIDIYASRPILYNSQHMKKESIFWSEENIVPPLCIEAS